MVTKQAHGFECFSNGFKWLKKRMTEKWEIIILEETGVVHIDLDIDRYKYTQVYGMKIKIGFSS